MKKQEKPIGLTKDAGWQFGLRKTFPYSKEHLWDFIFSDQGLKIWLGELEEELDVKKEFTTKEGITGKVSVFTPYSHIRMSWKKNNWEYNSTVQVRIIGDSFKATISFHHEKLLDNSQREEMNVYWNEKIAEIEKALMT